MRPSRLGKFNTKLLINKEIVAVRLNRNAILSEAFTKRLAPKSTTIYFLGDNAY